jgi:hypothetical protein
MYINDNMMAIKKILKKFDKNFSKVFGLITLKYLKRKVKNINSDFNYILQFKIIDESSVLIEDLTKELMNSFYKIKSDGKLIQSSQINKFSDDSSTVNELLMSADFNNYSPEEKTKSLVNEIFNCRSKLVEYSFKIDETNTWFRSKIRDWNFYIKNGVQIIHNHIQSGTKIGARSMIGIPEEEEHVLKKFVSGNDKIIDKDHQLSKENSVNITLSLIHTFFYMMNYTIVQPTSSSYVSELKANSIYSGIVMGMAPIAAIISTIVLSKWSNTSYKTPLIVSCILFIIGNLLYSMAWTANCVWVLAIGRLLVGFASGRIINRRYLIQFISKNSITKFSVYYVASGAIGAAMGPAIACILLYFKEFVLFDTFYVNQYTYPSWLCFALSIGFLILIIFFYTEPYSENFSMFKKCK